MNSSPAENVTVAAVKKESFCCSPSLSGVVYSQVIMCYGYSYMRVDKYGIMGTYDYSKVEKNTRVFLESLQKNSAPLDFSKISPEQARNVEMTLQAAPIEKLEADIEDHDIAGGPTGEVSIKLVLQVPVRQIYLL